MQDQLDDNLDDWEGHDWADDELDEEEDVDSENLEM